MPEPVHIAAIDAGSNAVRLSIARAYSALDIEPLISERCSLRLGEGVFVRHRFSEDIFKKSVKAFRNLHEFMEEYGVSKYRAVATSATREAQNRKTFLRRIKQATGISLEVISAKEESRLGREAVIAAMGPEAQPRCIVDLGGGSLELSVLRDHTFPLAPFACSPPSTFMASFDPFRPNRFAATFALFSNPASLSAPILPMKFLWPSAATPKRSPTLPPALVRTAFLLSNSLSSASASRTSSNATFAHA